MVVGENGLIATAYHVVAPANRMPDPRIDVRLVDGRILPARLKAFDEASDIALLDVDADLPVFDHAPAPSLADPVCIVSNAYGLDLSVTCGVVSARHVANAGFNRIEDFIQTDAAANPGSSGGALVDADGRLVGMMSAIFASSADTNIGVNFAVSADLLTRVVEDLKDDGRVDYVSAGWGLELPPRSELAIRAGVRVASLSDGPAAKAGLQVGDLLVAVAGRAVRHPSDVVSALALVRPGDTAEVVYVRAGLEAKVRLSLRRCFGGASKGGKPGDRNARLSLCEGGVPDTAGRLSGGKLRSAGKCGPHRQRTPGDQSPRGRRSKRGDSVYAEWSLERQGGALRLQG